MMKGMALVMYKGMNVRAMFLAVMMVMSFGVYATDEHLPTGRHVVADLHGCQQCYYRDDVEDALRKSAADAGATVLGVQIFTFPAVEVDGQMVQGMTGMVVLSESHIAFHTWPEFGYVACDIFTCGENALPEKGLDILVCYFQAQTGTVQILNRGLAALKQ